MIRVAPVQRCLQSKLILEKPGDNLDDEHIAKLIEVINDYPLADIRNSLMDFKYTYLSKYPDVFILEDEVQKELNNDLFKIKSYLDYEDGKIYLTYKLFYEDKPVDIADIYSLTAMKIYKTYLNKNKLTYLYKLACFYLNIFIYIIISFYKYIV